MLTTFLAYLLTACYFVIERSLRKGQQALSLQTGRSDRGSSHFMWISGLLNIRTLLLAPIFNRQHIGDLGNAYIGWIGLSVMVCGLTLRYWAAKALGEFYTRTLRIVEGHQIINQGPIIASFDILAISGKVGRAIALRLNQGDTDETT